MKKITKIILGVLFIMIIKPLDGFSQKKQVEGLKIGDKVPNVLIRGILNSSDTLMDLKKLYQDKLLIISFWATWFVPCIEELSGLDTLKSKYGNALNILSVCHDKPTLVTSFLNKHKEIRTTNLLITSDDKILTSNFPHKYLPHNVWINADGIVVAITDNVDLSDKNIKLFISGQKPKLAVKQDSRSFSFLKPLHVEDSLLSYRSIITKYNPELNSGDVTYEYNWRRFFGWNLNITDYFWLAYTKQLSQTVNWNAIELHTNDSVKFFYPKQAKALFSRSKYNLNGDFEEQERKWNKENLFCYELRLPTPVEGDRFRNFMFEDLYRFFKIKATIEYRKKECIIITSDKPLKKIGNPVDERSFIQKTSNEIKCQNVTLTDLFLSLNDTYNVKGELFLDNTDLQNICIDIKTPVNMVLSLNSLKIELEKSYGLHFKRKNISFPMLVLTDFNR